MMALSSQFPLFFEEQKFFFNDTDGDRKDFSNFTTEDKCEKPEDCPKVEMKVTSMVPLKVAFKKI